MSTGKAAARDLQTPTEWICVTIHRSDGHRSNGVFYTNDLQVLRDFYAAMQPLTVTCSIHPSFEAVQKFVSEKMNQIFVLIDPKTYKLEM